MEAVVLVTFGIGGQRWAKWRWPLTGVSGGGTIGPKVEPLEMVLTRAAVFCEESPKCRVEVEGVKGVSGVGGGEEA